jgi:hypothetical protein
MWGHGGLASKQEEVRKGPNCGGARAAPCRQTAREGPSGEQHGVPRAARARASRQGSGCMRLVKAGWPQEAWPARGTRTQRAARTTRRGVRARRAGAQARWHS